MSTLLNSILEYYRTHEIVYASDLAQAFDLDLRAAVAIQEILIATGCIQVLEEISLIKRSEEQ